MAAESQSGAQPRLNSRRHYNVVHPVDIETPPLTSPAPATPTVFREVKHFKKWVVWLIPTFVIINVIMFVITMYVNNCPKNSVSCIATFLGRFSFQPFKENPLLGPSSSALQKMGALDVKKVVDDHQGWLLITCNWLHGGVFHLLANMLSLLVIGYRLEQEFGFVRIGLLYVISGLGGSLLSSLFIQSNISVGASGALFGLLGAMLSELITNWTIYASKFGALFTLLIIIAINLAVGILPHVDNFAHIGGFLSGFFLGFVFLIRPQFGWVNQRYAPSEFRTSEVKSKFKTYQCIFWILSLVILIVGFTVGLVMLLRGVDANKHCSWCHYLSCVPTSKWSCRSEPAYCSFQLRSVSAPYMLVEMDEESVLPASMTGNSISKIEDKGQMTQVTEEMIDQLGVYQVDYSFWKIVQKLIYAPFYLPWVLLAAIIYPEKPEYFIYSSFISILLDPLFLYIPLINEETKCLMLDKKVMIAALILRVVTDLRYVVKIISKIKKWWPEMSKKIGITSNVLAILPVPQVVVLVFIPKMRGSGSLTILRFLNWLIFFQYLQRVYPIYRYCKNLNKEMRDKSSHMRAWIPSLVNLLIYLLASYVLGTFWYYFSIQREIDCWEYACQREVGCEFSIHCSVNTFRNVTLLHTSCPINPPDPKMFDFGIFLYALQSGMQESTNLPQKVLLCFSWGLRNLSSFASNLNTSNYGWETLFVVAISISGLIFFIYFLGHVQTFMQAAGKSEKSRQKLKILGPKVESMLLEYGFPADAKVLKDSINYVVEQKHSEEPDLVLESMFSVFSFKHKVADPSLQRELNTIRITLFLEKLKKLVLLLGLHKYETVLKEICKHLDPVIYPKGSYIVREKEPVDMMFFITQGIALSCTTDHSIPTRRLEKGDCYGEELLSWATTASTSFSDLPNSLHTVKAHKTVELFALQAADLQRVFSQPSIHSSRFT